MKEPYHFIKLWQRMLGSRQAFPLEFPIYHAILIISLPHWPFKPEVGFELHFYGNGNKNYLTYAKSGRVVAAKPNKKLAYTWSMDAAPAETLVTWKLFNESDKTCPVLTHTGLEKTSGNEPAYKRENYDKGWTSFMGKLDNYLNQ